MSPQSHKLCTRCQFLVPQKNKLCTTCGSNQFTVLTFEAANESEELFDATPAPVAADVSLIKAKITYPAPVVPVEPVESRISKNHRRPSPGTLRHKFNELESTRNTRTLWKVGR